MSGMKRFAAAILSATRGHKLNRGGHISLWLRHGEMCAGGFSLWGSDTETSVAAVLSRPRQSRTKAPRFSETCLIILQKFKDNKRSIL